MRLRLVMMIAFFASSIFYSVNAQNLRLSAGGGIALGETKFFKKNMLCSEFLIGYELSLGKEYQISVSAGLSGVSFDYYDPSFNSVYNDRTFITIPIVIRKYLNNISLKKYSSYYGIGFSGNWCFKDRKTIKNYQSSTTTFENFTGFNLGVCIEVGRQIKINKKSSLSLSLTPQIDLLTNYSNNLNKIKFVKNLFIATYSINLSKKK